MAEDLLELEEVAVVHDPVAGEGMAKIVKADVTGLVTIANARREAGGVEDLLEDFLEDPSGGLVHGPGVVGKYNRASTR